MHKTHQNVRTEYETKVQITQKLGQVIWSHRLCWSSPAGTSYTGV